MGKQLHQDPHDVSDGIKYLNASSPRKHKDPHTEVHTCRCGSIVVVPKGHSMVEDDDKEVLCHACDTPIGKKVYDALIKH